MKNTIYINGKKVKADELTKILKQQPNKNVLGWKPYLGLYNWGNPESEKGLSHWFTKIGEAPVIIDSTLVLKSAKQLGLYAFNNGYFTTVNSIKTRRNKKGNKIWVDYYLYTGQPYFFGNVTHLVATKSIEDIVLANRGNSVIENGAHYNSEMLEKERTNLVKVFRNEGYYGFQKSYIRFEADTSAGNRVVDIKMIITDQPVYYEDSTILIPHKPYKINNIYVDPFFSYTQKSSEKDTSVYEGYTILKSKENRYQSDLFTSSIHFNPHEQYNETKVTETYRHLIGLQVFRSSEITFEKTESNPYELNAFIKLRPFPKRSITLELEGTNTSGNYGIFASVSILNRSIFKRGEIFDITFRGGTEAQANIYDNDNIFNTIEYGVELGVTFPRFLIPAKWQAKFPKRMMPKSRISTSAGQQERTEFTRIYTNLGLGYSWKETQKKSHHIQLVDLSYLYLPRIEDEYLKSIEFAGGYDDAFIAATRYTFTYNNQEFGKSINRSYFTGSIEFAGNLLSLLEDPLNFETDPDTKERKVFGVAYSQYIKFDLDYRNYTKLNHGQQLAWRAFAGVTYTYGNTKGAPPFEKSYFAGGANDVRGWLAYKLGPGNYPANGYEFQDSTGSTIFYSATAPIKLMFNIEYRFNIIKSFKGAAFMDFGNIWYYNRPVTQESDVFDVELTKFKWENISQQIAISPGVGLRYDFGFFVLRLDAAYKLFNPGKPEDERVTILPASEKDINMNFAIGFPF